MGNLLTMRFWLNSRPDFMQSTNQKVLFGFIVFCLLVWLASYLLAKRKNANRKVLNSFASFGCTNGIIGFMLWFFAYERTPFLSARFWFLCWGAGIIAWLFLIYHRYRKVEEIKELTAKEREMKKYIPQ